LELAIWNKRRDCVAVLLEAGADPNLPCDLDPRISLLGLATLDADVEMVRLMLARGVNPNDRPPNGHSALGISIETSQKEKTRLLLEAGADPRLDDGYELPIIHRAVMYGYPQQVLMLLEHGVDVNRCDARGRTALDLCGESDSVRVMLMRAGARPGIGRR